jgi:molecular chaperone DnaK
MFGATVSKDLNPEEAVVCGAATNAAMRLGLLGDRTFFDVTSHNMGLEDDNGMFEIIMRKNEPYPVSFTQRFTTASDDINDITVHVLQDTAHSSLNVSDSPEDDPDYFISLAKLDFTVDNSEGEKLIDICFIIDDSGIVTVTAKDVNSGREADFTLKAPFDSDKIENIKIY